jgi:hypothetical protein
MLLAAAPAHSTLITAANCQIELPPDGFINVSDPSYCDPEVFGSHFAIAGTQASQWLSGNTFEAHLLAHARGGSGEYVDEAGSFRYATGAAEATVDLDKAFITPGPVRDGLIDLSVYFTSIGVAALGSFELKLGDLLNLASLSPEFAFDSTLPITLGRPFDLSILVLARAGPLAEGAMDTDHRFATLDMDFSITELDGTPVPLYETPEPATWGLLTFGLVAIGCLRAFRSSATIAQSARSSRGGRDRGLD